MNKELTEFKQELAKLEPLTRSHFTSAIVLANIYSKVLARTNCFLKESYQKSETTRAIALGAPLLANLASNPNTPSGILIALSFEHFEAFKRNPAIEVFGEKDLDFYRLVVANYAAYYSKEYTLFGCFNDLRKEVNNNPNRYPDWFQQTIAKSNDYLYGN